jgi:type IX secretion system PorP/SprF family membrane protein
MNREISSKIVSFRFEKKFGKFGFIIRLALLILTFQNLSAQDIHFSQFENAPLYVNPALNGLYNGQLRLVSNYRNQWFSVPVPYMTISSSLDAKILSEKIKNNVLSLGALFHYDVAGDTRLSLTHILLNLSYHQQLFKGFFIGAGVQFGYGQRRLRRDLMTFDDQFNGDVFNPGILSADISNLSVAQLSFLDVGSGINLRYQKSSRTWLNAGVAMVHLNTPKQSFMGQDIRLKTRTSVNFNASFQINEKWDILPGFLYQAQHVYREILFSAYTRFHLNRNLGRETAIYYGAAFRLNDAIIPTIGLNYQGWQFALSYDVNISKFNAATDSQGGIEFSLIHIWRTVPGLPKIKSCPIF